MKRAALLALSLSAACALPAATKIGGPTSSSGVILSSVGGVPGATGPSTSHHVFYDAGLKRWFVFALGKQSLRAASSTDFAMWKELDAATITDVMDPTAFKMDAFPASPGALHVALSGPAASGTEVLYVRAKYDAAKVSVGPPIVVAKAATVIQDAPAVAPDNMGFVHVFSDVASPAAATAYISMTSDPYPVSQFNSEQLFMPPLTSAVHDLESNVEGDGTVTALWEDAAQETLRSATYKSMVGWMDSGPSVAAPIHAGDWGVCDSYVLRRETSGDFTFTNGGAGQPSPPTRFPGTDPVPAGVALACGETEVIAAMIDADGQIITSTFLPGMPEWSPWTAITKSPGHRVGISASRALAGKSAAVIWTELDESVTPMVWNVRGALLTVN